MTFTLKTLPYFVASVAILLGTSTSIAAKRPAPSARSVGPTELEMQVLLDRADFSPGEIDGKGGKNSREALAAFQTSRGIAPGARSRKALLKALGAGTVKPIVLYTITAADVAGPFAKMIPEDAIGAVETAGPLLHIRAARAEREIPLGTRFAQAPEPPRPFHRGTAHPCPQRVGHRAGPGRGGQGRCLEEGIEPVGV